MRPLDDLEFTSSMVGGRILERTETTLVIEYQTEADARRVEVKTRIRLANLHLQGFPVHVQVERQGRRLTTKRG